jgi:hypothetical protein
MKRFLHSAILSLALAASAPAFAANTFGTDFSDLWWNPAESGWGVTLTHQDNAIFATLFVYAPDGSAKWYSGAAFASSTTAPVFSGQFFEGHGPYFGAATFNPALASNRLVGTVTLNMTSVSTATMTYTVDGVAVTKSIQRQTFAANALTGNYMGAIGGTDTNCGASSGNFTQFAQYAIVHSGSNITISAAFQAASSCNYQGTYTQSGRMGSIDGSFVCSNGSGGAFHAVELEASYQAFFTRYTADYGGGCVETGRISGMKLN